ncbi:hypothetical protein ACI65C_000966 [Semiaphis heraclei]
MQLFSTTRWTSHDRVLIVINETYSALLETLEEISDANNSDREASSTAENLIIDMRSEQGCKDLVDQGKLFSIENNLTERDFAQVRLRRKKMMAGEQARDELTVNPEDNFETDVFYRILDTIISSIEN